MSWLRRLWLRLLPPDPDERYLAAATDHADLEHRMRVLERARSGPPFPTFNQ